MPIAKVCSNPTVAIQLVLFQSHQIYFAHGGSAAALILYLSYLWCSP